MKNYLYRLVAFFLLSIAYPSIGSAQDSTSFDFNYEVNKILPPISITREKLKTATTLIDLNRHYKSSWIRTYYSVEIRTINQGTINKAISKNDTLVSEQKRLMNTADMGTDIAVRVIYLPENTLVNNDRKEMNFTFTIDPEKEASYVGGGKELSQYLEKNGIDKITSTTIKEHNLAAVKFAINEMGQVIEAHVVESSKDEKIDQLLLETVCNMPDWEPATYTDGSKTKQEFVLTVGDHRSCVVNLLNIRRLEVEGK